MDLDADPPVVALAVRGVLSQPTPGFAISCQASGPMTSSEEDQPKDSEDSSSNQLVQADPAAPSKGGFLVPAEAFAEMFRDWAFRRQPRRSAVYPNAFVVDEDTFNRLHDRIVKRLEEVCVAPPVVQISVGYSDLSAESFTDWNSCFTEAVDTSDAERLEATWEGVDPHGGIYQVGIRCITEMPLVTARELGPMPEEARIEASATAPKRDWVGSTLNSIAPLLKESRISKMFRPLELFRRTIVREIGSWVVGATAWYVSFQLLQKLVADPGNQEKLDDILSQDTLDERFVAFVEQFYGPQESFIAGLLVFMIPWGLFFVGLILGRQLLGYVVPRSAINIGLATKRYRDYMNLFRFAVFTVFVGTLLAVLANLISELF